MNTATSKPPSPDAEDNNYLSLEFFLFLIPCYYGLFSLLYRYHWLSSISPLYHIPHIPAQRFLLRFL